MIIKFYKNKLPKKVYTLININFSLIKTWAIYIYRHHYLSIIHYEISNKTLSDDVFISTNSVDDSWLKSWLFQPFVEVGKCTLRLHLKWILCRFLSVSTISILERFYTYRLYVSRMYKQVYLFRT